MPGQSAKYTGSLTVMLNKKVVREKKNVLLNVGKTYLVQRIMDDGTAPGSGTACHAFYVGTTTSGGQATATDTTAATTEIGRAAFTYASGGTIGRCSATATFVSATANGTITEAGIFAGGVTSGDGVFVARALFTGVAKTTADTLTIKWDVSFA